MIAVPRTVRRTSIYRRGAEVLVTTAETSIGSRYPYELTVFGGVYDGFRCFYLDHDTAIEGHRTWSDTLRQEMAR